MPTAAERISSLRQLLNGPHDSEARRAACELGRMRSRAREAVDDLIAAATRPWECGCPQRFADAMGALLRIAPDDPRLVPVIRDTIRCSNYGIQKVCVLALRDIGTAEAIETLFHLDRYWHASPKSGAFKKLMYLVLGEVAGDRLNGVLADPVAARDRLVAWLEDRLPGPPCPRCGQPLRTERARQCFACGADWHAGEGVAPDRRGV